MSGAYVSLFAGPGGWCEGMRSVGIGPVVGLEWDAAACATRAAAGHPTIRCDMATYPVEPYVGRCRGLVASPPCQAWSNAGKGDGRREIDRVLAAVEMCRHGWTDAALAGPWLDERTPLILQPLRWAWALRPAWLALEQVPPALRVWEVMADVLRGWGYAATALVLNAADYGVPQTRKRAFLLAGRHAAPLPVQTHAQHPHPQLFGPTLRPWRSMVDAVGWGFAHRPAWTLACSGGATSPIGGTGALNLIRRAQREGGWVDGPAGLAMLPADALALQSFPSRYPCAGPLHKQMEQACNAVPPLLSAAVVSALVTANEPESLAEAAA